MTHDDLTAAVEAVAKHGKPATIVFHSIHDMTAAASAAFVAGESITDGHGMMRIAGHNLRIDIDPYAPPGTVHILEEWENDDTRGDTPPAGGGDE